MKLASRKNGLGYVTSYTITFGSHEAKDLKLVDENGNLKKIKSVKTVSENTLMIFLEEI